jgi:uncharacterized protein (TIGR02996 family)
MTEDQLLKQIAERPFDIEQRLVFADFLAELGDPRAEVIALSIRGNLSGAERRHIRRIVADHVRRWLGPLELIADSAETTFLDGFLDSLVLGAGARSADLSAFLSEPRLCTVRSLDAKAIRKAQPLSQFLRQPSFGSLLHVISTPGGLDALNGAPLPFRLETIGVADSGYFVDALAPLAEIVVARKVETVKLVTPMLFASHHAQELFSSIRDQLSALTAVRNLSLVCKHGVFEGIATWLTLPHASRELLGARWPTGQRWSVEAPGLTYTLVRDHEGAFPTLNVHLAGEWLRDVEDSIARFISVLVLLGQATLKEVHIFLPARLTANRDHRQAIRAAARRLRGTTVVLSGETLTA